MDVGFLLADPAQGAVTIQAETLTETLWAELMPLLERHYLAISGFPDVALAPRRDIYATLQANGRLHVFTARTAHGALVGYIAWIVDTHVHYASLLVASQDVLWIEPEHRSRRWGSDLITVSERALEVLGVRVFLQHSKVRHPIGAILTRLGYEPMDTIYAKRID
jgi:hypothetical protein